MKKAHRYEKSTIKNLFRLPVLIAIVAIVGVTGLAYAALANGSDQTELELQAGPFAPGASGEISFSVRGGILSGSMEAQGLPAQGSHAVYVLWFVRTDTGDKAFLGPIVGDGSILFLNPGSGEMKFSASAFTAGNGIGKSILLGAQGSNFFVLIAENQINTFTPSPVSPPPTSFALMATF